MILRQKLNWDTFRTQYQKLKFSITGIRPNCILNLYPLKRTLEDHQITIAHIYTLKGFVPFTIDGYVGFSITPKSLTLYKLTDEDEDEDEDTEKVPSITSNPEEILSFISSGFFEEKDSCLMLAQEEKNSNSFCLIFWEKEIGLRPLWSMPLLIYIVPDINHLQRDSKTLLTRRFSVSIEVTRREISWKIIYEEDKSLLESGSFMI